MQPEAQRQAAPESSAPPAAADRSAQAQEAARSAGLRYVSPDKPGIRREREGEGFAYWRADGRRVEDEATLERIRRLAIPPAWTDVWICPQANGHLQATGRDARGRKQYRYHPQFREVRESHKYEHMLDFARALPQLRSRIDEHMRLPGLPREKVLATVVHLLQTTLIRVGNEDYARQNKSYGLTTLANRHVKVEGAELRFHFKGKSGKVWRLRTSDRRVAKVVRACQELPGQELFAYLDDSGQACDVSSDDVNTYLREISGRDITAKDFRTWAGTVMAALALHASERAETQRAARHHIKAATEQAAARLGNTPAVTRKGYVHPEIFQAYAAGALVLELEAEAATEGLSCEECAVLRFLEQRLGETVEDMLSGSLAALAQQSKPKPSRAPRRA